jgi:hypothetical protein
MGFSSIESRIPEAEKKVWNSLINLPRHHKQLLWNLIKDMNKDNITIYRGELQNLKYLSNQKLIYINNLYPYKRNEYSLIIMQDSPHLLRILKRMS